MKKLEDFLKKFQVIKDPSKNKERISDIIFNITKQRIEAKDIDIKGNKITTKTHPAIKAVLFSKKDLVLEKINKDLDLKIVTFI